MSFYRSPTSIHPTAPIKLSSQILLSTTADIKALDEQQRATSDEYRAQAVLVRPDIRGTTNTSYSAPASHATIDTTDRRPVAGKTTPGAIDEDAQRKADVDRLLRNEPLEEIPDPRSKMSQLARLAEAINVATEKKKDVFRAEHQKLSAAYCAKIKPDHDAKTKQIIKLFGEAYGIYVELQKTRQDLVASEIGFHGLFNVDLDFFRGEEVRKMFHDAVKAGYVSSIPEALRV